MHFPVGFPVRRITTSTHVKPSVSACIILACRLRVSHVVLGSTGCAANLGRPSKVFNALVMAADVQVIGQGCPDTAVLAASRTVGARG